MSQLFNATALDGEIALVTGASRGIGASIAATLAEAGAKIVKLVFAVDRLQGARENVEAAGFEFHALLTKEDMGIP